MRDRVFLSSEKEFVFRSSYNRGYTQKARMIEHCLDLSPSAKVTYGIIASFVFEDGEYAFPSVGRIALALGCSERRAREYINELVEKGFIHKKRRGRGKTNNYYLVDLDDVPHLKVSEMVWQVLDKLNKEDDIKWEHLYSCVDKFIRVLHDNNIQLGDIEVSDVSSRMLRELFLNLLKGGDIVMEYIRTRKHPNKPQQLSLFDTNTEEKYSKRVNLEDKNHWSNRPVEKWTRTNFVEYFYYKYLKATGRPHSVTKTKHVGMIGNCLRRVNNDKELLKKYIDAFFEMGYEIPSLEVFSSSARFPEIELYLNEGKKPYYLKKKSKTSKMSEDEIKEWEEKYKHKDMYSLEEIFGRKGRD